MIPVSKSRKLFPVIFEHPKVGFTDDDLFFVVIAGSDRMSIRVNEDRTTIIFAVGVGADTVYCCHIALVFDSSCSDECVPMITAGN